MFSVSGELQTKLEDLNRALRKQQPFDSLDRATLRSLLSEHGQFIQLHKYDADEITKWFGDDMLVGIDGSTNFTRGMQSRSVHLFQVLAKSNTGKELWSADLYTPLLQEEDVEPVQLRKMLSELELGMCDRVLSEWSPKLLLLDGSLLHFCVEHPEKTMELFRSAERGTTLIAGVAEEFATDKLAKAILPQYPMLSDADVLCGVLDVGEAFLWDFYSDQGLWRAAVRSAQNPQPIIIDGLLSQIESRESLLKLAYTLSPAQGRGIPIWLDIVDQQVRITDALLEGLLERFIDADLRKRLLASKRRERII